MTRSEAIQVFNRTRGKKHLAEGMIDIFVALGMLKIEEPKSIEDRIATLMSMPGIAEGPLPERIKFLEWALGDQGLKITAK